MRFLIPLFIFIAIPLSILAQDNKYLSASYFTGPVYDHRNISSILPMGTARGVGVEYLHSASGADKYHSRYRYPNFGYAAYYEDAGNRDVLGHAFSAAIVSQFHIIRQSLAQLNMNLQVGMGYNSKKFDSRDNPTNMLIGSHLSAFFRIAPELVLMPSGRVSPLLGLNFVHYSNGRIKLPNLGLNFAQINVGCRLRLNADLREPLSPDEARNAGSTGIVERQRLTFSLSAGVREYTQPEGDKYLVMMLSGSYVLPLWQSKCSIGAGFDVKRDGALANFYADPHFSDLVTVGLRGGAFMRFSSSIEAGIEFGGWVISDKEHVSGMYDRVSVNYYPWENRNFYFHVGLNTTLMKAQFIEWGVGIPVLVDKKRK